MSLNYVMLGSNDVLGQRPDATGSAALIAERFTASPLRTKARRAGRRAGRCGTVIRMKLTGDRPCPQ